MTPEIDNIDALDRGIRESGRSLTNDEAIALVGQLKLLALKHHQDRLILEVVFDFLDSMIDGLELTSQGSAQPSYLSILREKSEQLRTMATMPRKPKVAA